MAIDCHHQGDDSDDPSEIVNQKQGDAPDKKPGVVYLAAQIVRLIIVLIDVLSR